MELDLDLGPDEVAIQDAVERFCDQHLGTPVERRAVKFSRDLWRAFAELGVIEACHPANPDGALQACVALEVLGGAGFQGPVPQVVAAASALAEADWAEVALGNWIATVGVPPLIPWAGEAEIILVIDGARVRRLDGPVQPARTLADMRSGRTGDPSGPDCGAAEPLLARYDMAVAAWVQGAGRTALDLAADHARTRRQFGKTLGEFQAVSFPLAEAFMALNAARIINRFAAMAIDKQRPDAAPLAAAARLSACRAALKTCFSAHQIFGASGQLLDGPVAWLSRPIQEYAAQTRGLRVLREQLPLDVVGGLDLDAWAR